jgi:glycosyltransferase involved in cell wall biosynthesis
MISDWYYPKLGGIEYAIDSLARNLSLRGHEVHIITRSHRNLQLFIPAEGLKVIRLKSKELTSRFLVPGAYKELYDILKNENYDIIHAHGLDSPLAIISLIFSRILRTPAIITNHSVAGKGPIRIPLHLAGKVFLKNTRAVIAVSSAVEKDTRIMSDKPLYLIHNGIDIPSPAIADDPFSLNMDGRIVITNVSRMTRKKGVLKIIEIASGLIEKHPDLLVIMVGDGPLKKKLEKKVEIQNMTRNFTFTGQVSKEAVFSILEKSDIFIMPSKDEAFGIAILEAFAKKVPVIAMNNSGVADIVTHEKTGFLAENVGDIRIYAEKLIVEPKLRNSLSMTAFDSLVNYKWTDIAKKTEGVYDQVLHEKNIDLN